MAHFPPKAVWKQLQQGHLSTIKLGGVFEIRYTRTRNSPSLVPMISVHECSGVCRAGSQRALGARLSGLSKGEVNEEKATG